MAVLNKELRMVTYLRDNEEFSNNLIRAAQILSSITQKLTIVVFCDFGRTIGTHGFNMEIINMTGTKYARLRRLMLEDSDYCYVSIDNDIMVEKCFEEFVLSAVTSNSEVAWARIAAQKEHGFIANLVVVDKLLSHNLLRPLLWKFHVGITIPGQCFVIKNMNLPPTDTFLDDIAIGMFVRKSRSKIYTSANIIARERPNVTFKSLFGQRKRWAKGFYSLFSDCKSGDEHFQLMAHAFVYHFLWIPHYAVLWLLFLSSPPVCVLYIALIAAVISQRNIRYTLWAILYQFVFPVFHIWWIYNVLKGERNNDNS